MEVEPVEPVIFTKRFSSNFDDSLDGVENLPIRSLEARSSLELASCYGFSTLSRRQWPSCHRTQSRYTCRLWRCQRIAQRKSRWTGISRLHRVSSSCWGDCLYQWRQTTSHSWQTWGLVHNSRVDGADTCQAGLCGEPRHCCSPSLQLASLR